MSGNPPRRNPGRYVIHHHVASPLTCRHKYRCACHGQPENSKPPADSEKVRKAIATGLDRHFIEVAGLLARALEDFPGARDSVDRTIAEFRKRHNI